jgi:glycosyltransferase involved in cell wall biosynthesis
MKKLCIVLPFPPPNYGPSMYSVHMIDALNDIEDIEYLKIDSELNTSSHKIGRFSLIKLSKFLKLVINVSRKSKNSNLILNLHLSLGGSFKTFLLILLNYYKIKTLTLILHEGGLKESLKKSFITKILIKFSVDKSDVIFALDEDQKNTWSDVYKDTNFEIIPAYRNEQPSLPRKTKRVVFLANLIPDKGVFDTLDIWNNISEIDKSDHELLIMGSTMSKEIENHLIAIVEKMKNTELIINPHRELVLELFSSSKIFIYPSTYFYEQQPSVIIEALSFHIPVVAYKWRGINNLIKDTHNGLLSEPRDINTISENLVKLMNDPILYESLSSNSFNEYKKYYSKNSYIENFKSIVKKYYL